MIKEKFFVVNKPCLPAAPSERVIRAGFGQEISAFPIFTDVKWFMHRRKDNNALIKDKGCQP